MQTDAVLQANVLPKLKQLLHSSKNNLVKEAAWAISNITAGSSDQIQKVIDANILPDLMEVLTRVIYFPLFYKQADYSYKVYNFFFSLGRF